MGCTPTDGLELRIYVVEGLYYVCSEIKGTDQLCGYRTAEAKIKIRFVSPDPTYPPNSPYPNNFIAIFSCKIYFFISKDRICIAKAVSMQAGLKFVLVLFIV